MKPTLKAPRIKRLKLKCDDPLSNMGFKFNMRRYSKVDAVVQQVAATVAPWEEAAAEEEGRVAGACTRPLLSST